MWKKVLNKESLKKLVVISLLKKVLIFAILFMANDALAASCEAGFSETFDIKVIDAHYRPIEGAAVNITYQKDVSTGKGYVTTNTQYTGTDGTITETVRNTEQFDNKVDCNVVIGAEYDGKTVEETVKVHSHEAEIRLRFEDAYLLGLSVVDLYGAPLANTQVRINDMYRNTSDNGYVGIIVNAGTVDVAVPYLSGVLAEQIEVTGDMSYTMHAKVYPFKLSVVDDAGAPLVAEIYVEDLEYYDSEVEIPEMALTTPYVKVVYGSIEKVVPVDLTSKSDYTVSFDLNAPEIRNVEVEQAEGELKIRFYLHDPNYLASGVDLDETTVTYTVGGISTTAIPYADSGAYVVEIPAPPINTLLRFTITTHDKEGNMNTVNGEYLVIPEEEENGSSTGEENGTPPETTDEGDNNWILIAVGVVVILIFAYAIWSYVRGLSEDE